MISPRNRATRGMRQIVAYRFVLPPEQCLRLIARYLTAAVLEAWRQERGWTQREAAERYGIHERNWRKYENATRVIPQRLVRWMSTQ